MKSIYEKNYYNLNDEYYHLISYDYRTGKETYDLKHKFKLTKVEMLYGFIPLGTAYCKELNKFINGNLYVFVKCSELDEEKKEITLFDFDF